MKNEKIKELLLQIDRRLEDKVLQTSEAELLKKLISNADSVNEAMNIARMGTVYKRTGLHFTPRIKHKTNEISYFKKRDDLSFSDKDSPVTHKLIIGDNYDALLNLLIEYRNSIDFIYIDPPYGKDKMGEFAKTNYENDINRDNLLSMLYTRLVLAKQLLSDDGVIFCSIDDKNQAYVKCLFDDVFGEINFISNMCRETIKGGSKAKNIKQVHDYVIVYAKQRLLNKKEKTLLLGDEFEEENAFIYKDSKGVYAKGRELNKWGAGSRREDSPSMWFPIRGPHGEDVYPIRNDGSDGRWRWGKKKLLKAVEEDDVIFEKREDDTYIVYEKIRKNKSKNTQLVSILKDKYINANGSEDLKKIFNTLMSQFDYAKPVELIKELLTYMPSDDYIVLDFFAGSGSTGQAVLDLNKDGGSRKFILCQINEPDEKNPDGIVIDTTAPRLKRIMTGECYDGNKDFKWIKENEPYGGSLDVYEIKYVSEDEDEKGKTAFDVIDETLYGKEKMTTKEKIDWVCQKFTTTEWKAESDKDWEKRERENTK